MFTPSVLRLLLAAHFISLCAMQLLATHFFQELCLECVTMEGSLVLHKSKLLGISNSKISLELAYMPNKDTFPPSLS